MKKYDNIVISMDYTSDICYEQYTKIRDSLKIERYSETGEKIGKLQDEFPESIRSDECDSWYKKIYIAKQSIIGLGCVMLCPKSGL